ncbi:MAG: hypothetical protein HS104_05280 [Polyangiaceae bacterium]|nr:hypothetical protein [Polyangiaceae bacterium]
MLALGSRRAGDGAGVGAVALGAGGGKALGRGAGRAVAGPGGVAGGGDAAAQASATEVARVLAVRARFTSAR